MPMKPHEFVEAIRTLEACELANPLPSADDRAENRIAYATLRRNWGKAASLAWRKAQGQPVAPSVVRFLSARELWKNEHGHNIPDDE